VRSLLHLGLSWRLALLAVLTGSLTLLLGLTANAVMARRPDPA
jgi:cytosine/uracil/thiamine/allantoin permease